MSDDRRADAILLLLLLVGPLLVYNSWQKWQTYRDASGEPVFVELADLESGDPVPDLHLWIGEHYALYSHRVVVEPTSYGRNNVARPHMYHPIVSKDHPYHQARQAAIAAHGSLNGLRQESIELESFAVLVRSERVRDTRLMLPAESVTGLVISDIEDLNDRDVGRLKQAFPHIDWTEVTILGAGETPILSGTVLVFFVVGVVAFLLGIYAVFQEFGS